MAAARAIDRLLDLLPPIDVGEPKAWIAAAAAVFAQYPAEVWDAAILAVVARTKRPGLDDVKAELDAAYGPIERAIERQRAEKSHRRALPPPREERTPERQAEIDRQVESVRKHFNLAPDAVELPKARTDGQHYQRIKDDLETRRARREQGSAA